MVLRNPHKYGKGEGLEPVLPLDLGSVNSFEELLSGMSQTAFGGRALGEAADVLFKMIQDPECFKVLTLSGAMTIAKMGLVVTEMIDRGWINCVVSTGALMCHGFVETSGRLHFKHDPSMNDEKLFKLGYNRVFDTLELEENLDEIELIIRKIMQSGYVELFERGEVKSACSHSFTRALGRWLKENTEPGARAMLKSCYEKGVPVFIPAFTDSELALDFAIYGHLYKPVPFDPFHDLEYYTSLVRKSNRIGILTIGGGVPRNWAQQVGPYLDILSKRLKNKAFQTKRFSYGIRICPEPEHWGGLSGCSYSEGVSWGKFIPPADGGRFAEVHSDATIAWPILVKAVMERTDRLTASGDSDGMTSVEESNVLCEADLSTCASENGRPSLTKGDCSKAKIAAVKRK